MGGRNLWRAEGVEDRPRVGGCLLHLCEPLARPVAVRDWGI